jgi:hypothetical protein
MTDGELQALLDQFTIPPVRWALVAFMLLGCCGLAFIATA